MARCLFLFLLALPLTASATPKKVNLRDAVRGKMIALEARAASGYSKAALKLRNRGTEPITVDWSDSYLRPSGGSYQRLALAHTPEHFVREMTIAPGETKTVKILSFCMDQKKSGPRTGKRYVIARRAIRKDLGAALHVWHHNPTLSQGAVQSAVWSKDPIKSIAVALSRPRSFVKKQIETRTLPPARTLMAVSADGDVLFDGPVHEVSRTVIVGQAPEAPKHETSELLEVVARARTQAQPVTTQFDADGARLKLEKLYSVAGTIYALAESKKKNKGSSTGIGRGLYLRDALTGRWHRELELKKVADFVGHPTDGHAVLDGDGRVHVKDLTKGWTSVEPRRGVTLDGLMLLPHGGSTALVAVDRKEANCFRLVRKNKKFRWGYIGKFSASLRYGWTANRFFRFDADKKTLEIRKTEAKANYKVIARDVEAIHYGKHVAWIIGKEGEVRVYDERTEELKDLGWKLTEQRHIHVRYGTDELYVKSVAPTVTVHSPN